jgi:ABC-type Fe3+ transport system substrate-binding protein
MPVLAGLAVVKGAHDMNGAMALIDYLDQPETQILTVGKFPQRRTWLVPVDEPSPLTGKLNAMVRS